MRLLSVLGLILMFAACTIAADSPLVAAAKKEKERREKIKSPKEVTTNEDVEAFIEKKRAAGEIPEASEPAVTNSGVPQDTKIDAEQSSTDYGSTPAKKEEEKGKDYWRGRKRDLEAKIAAAEDRIAKLKDSTLYKDVDLEVQVKDPQGNIVPGGYTRDRRNHHVDQDAMQALKSIKGEESDLEYLRQQLEDLSEEARKAGALPGWLRD